MLAARRDWAAESKLDADARDRRIPSDPDDVAAVAGKPRLRPGDETDARRPGRARMTVAMKLIAAGMLVASVFLVAATGCDSSSSATASFGSGPSSYGPGCERFASCGSCTPVAGCGWCEGPPGAAGCFTGPDSCAAPGTRWTWDDTGCLTPADASVVPLSTDAGAADSAVGADGSAVGRDADAPSSDGAASDAADSSADTGVAESDGDTADAGDTDAEQAPMAVINGAR